MLPRRLPHGLLVGILVLLVHASFGGHALAGIHFVQGDGVGEPLQGSPSLRVLQEELAIDLREVGEPRGRALFRIRYRVRNDGAAQTLPLAPVPANQAGRSVRVDRIAVAPAAGEQGRRELAIAPGEHEVEVTFQAAPDSMPWGEVRGFGVDYDLGAARGWGSLGPLTVEVMAPAGWELVERPAALAVANEPDQYQARFAIFPRGDITHIWPPEAAAPHPERPDLLRIQLTPPLGLHRVLWGIELLAALASLLGSVLAVRWLAGSRGAGKSIPWPRRLVVAVVGTSWVMALPAAALFLHLWLFPHVANVFWMFAVVVATWILGALYCWVGCLIAGRFGAARAAG